MEDLGGHQMKNGLGRSFPEIYCGQRGGIGRAGKQVGNSVILCTAARQAQSGPDNFPNGSNDQSGAVPTQCARV